MNPPTIESNEGEKDAVLETAKFMLTASRTAPKTGGRDDILTSIVYGKEKNAIAEEMERMVSGQDIEFYFRQDAKNVRDSEAVVLVGIKGNKSYGLDCGACGYESCENFREAHRAVGKYYIGPTCFFKAVDIGIALSSAAKIASTLNVDNRMMFTVGAAALKLKLLLDATAIIGIPVSAKGKNVYFDRSSKP